MKFDHSSKDFPYACHNIFSYYRDLNIGAVNGDKPYIFNSVFTYQDIKEVLNRFDVFSSVMPEINELLLKDAGALIENDPPCHTKYKSIVQPELYIKSNQELQGFIKKLVDQTMSFNYGKEIDAVELIGGTISVKVICKVIGINDKEELFLRDWTNRFSNSVGNELVSTDKKVLDKQKLDVSKLHLELTNMLTTESLKLESDSKALLNTSRNWQINYEDSIGIIKSIAFAGNHSTALLIANALYLFAKHKSQLELLKSNFEKYGISACYEVLRYMGTFRGIMRKVKKNYELKSGHKFNKDDYALVWLSSGNRDSKVFKNPNEFDIRRENLTQQLSFGYGRHFCIGFQLATYELIEVLSYICENNLHIEIIEEPIKISDPWVDGFESLKIKIT